jgi:hypothetical protein
MIFTLARVREVSTEKVARRSAKLLRIMQSLVRTPVLVAVSQLSRRPLVDPDAQTDISLTSYGDRLSRVHLTIESIAQGRCRPGRLILYVDPEVEIEKLPRRLLKLRKRGLEIERSWGRFGPHTKYYPYVKSQRPHSRALITADDDTLYPRDWMLRLEAAALGTPKEVLCYRAHRVDFAGDGSLRPYNSWEPVRSLSASYRNFATGVSGVRYPAELLDRLADMGEAFVGTCPLADDVWLHYVAVAHSFRVRQIGAKPKKFPEIVSSQRQALHLGNTGRSGNDAQIACTYTGSALSRIREESAS